MSNKLLEINNITHNYGPTSKHGFTLEAINLSISHGELIGLLGPSGCGKTTLLRLIAGFEKPIKGSISFDGQIISSPSSVLPPERRGIGMVFQDYALFPHLNVWRNICFGLDASADVSRARWLLELVGLQAFVEDYPHQLSGGQRQRLALARALAPGSSLIVLDEPFCSLDVEVRHHLRGILSNVLKSCSATAILVTHDPHEALGICNRVAVMKDGRLHQCSTPQDLLARPMTPFVGKFVFQNNVVKINCNQDNISTPFGSVIVKSHLLEENPNYLLFDESSLSLAVEQSGKSTVLSKEFAGSHWIVRVESYKQVLRVKVPLDSTINIGDPCKLDFVPGKYGLIYPGCISCILKKNI